MASREALEAEALQLFAAVGLEENTAQSALKNPKFRQCLVDVIKEAGVTEGCPKAKGNLLYTVAGKFPANALVHRPLLLEYVLEEKIKSNAQLDGAMDYLKKVGGTSVDASALEEAAGVGVVVTEEQIEAAVAEVIKQHEQRLREDRYHFNMNLLLGQVARSLRWADGSVVRAVLERRVAELLGPKTAADLAPPEKKKKVKAEKPDDGKKKEAAAAAKKAEPQVPAVQDDPYAFFPKPEDNNQVHTTVSFSDGRLLRIANTPEKLAEHLKATGGKVVTRFPPEPNGYLHIGHAKAMFVDFGMARQYGGVCYLRYDDTNPAAEKKEYVDHIEEIVAWMGWQPWKITHASDYFDQLHAYAVQLIKSGNAFVCHQTKDEIEASREAREPSPWRDRPVEESLKLFEDMRKGVVDEGKAVLRMKQDHKNDNYNMFDLIAYRIKFQPHPQAGDKWCIYPSYDFTHCLCDAIENITHSLCTLEFESRRASYYWLLDVLDTYKPVVWEYSRLNITHNVLSKRKLNRLVTDHHVSGWDDPRLLTLSGLRRRGVTATSINNFCHEIGVTRNENTIPLHKLEHHIRLDLDASSPRALAVMRPLRVVITNLPEDHVEEIEAKRFPGRDDSGYKLPFSRVVYIESTDYREVDSKDYYGLAPGKSVMLRYAYPITCTGARTDASGTVVELTAEVDRDFRAQARKPPKGVLNWVARPAPGQEPHTAEFRLYDVLFKSEDPPSGDDWLDDLNPHSLEVVQGAYISSALSAAQPGDKFQFERLGYFAADLDSKPEAPVFNRTVTLRDSFPKAK